MLPFLFGFALAEEPMLEMTIEAHKDIEVYVVPTKVLNKTKIPYQLDSTSVFAHTITDVKFMQEKVTYGYARIDRDIYVYNEDTIKFAWPDCDYNKKPRDCAYQNGHYTLESYITFDKQQVVVRLVLYDENLIPIGQTSETNTRVVKITKREKVTNEVTQISNPGQRINGTTSTYSQTTKEDLEPSVVVIEPRLLDKDIKQASIKLWSSIKID